MDWYTQAGYPMIYLHLHNNWQIYNLDGPQWSMKSNLSTYGVFFWEQCLYWAPNTEQCLFFNLPWRSLVLNLLFYNNYVYCILSSIIHVLRFYFFVETHFILFPHYLVLLKYRNNNALYAKHYGIQQLLTYHSGESLKLEKNMDRRLFHLVF